VIASFTVSSGYEKMGELLEKCKNLDGVICATDTMAAGAMQYLREHNIQVPGQILMAGQGDSEMARVTAPPLITVHYSYEKSGETAIQMLMEILSQGETALKEVKLGYYMVDSEWK
jgi:LacI family sucrose operon transcriptional repressor